MFLLLLVTACCDTQCEIEREMAARAALGGGQDAVAIHLPFPVDELHLCSQGAGGSYSHQSTPTRYDADFDTSNATDEIVYAPVSGVAYVHDADPYTNFGYHINIDMGDGSYIILAHLDSVFVADGSEVAAGQMLGFEGTTGNSSGDHLHIGRHDGDAALDGIYGTSLEGLEFLATDASAHEALDRIAVTDLVCDLSSGHYYGSALPVPLWHPDGSLVKTPDTSTVYLVETGGLSMFMNEESFLSRSYDFSDVILVSQEELLCYGQGPALASASAVTAVYDNVAGSGVWLLVGAEGSSDRYRQKVGSLGWQGVLKTWGITASTLDDLSQESVVGLLADYPVVSGSALYRDGALVSPDTASDVFFMSNGIAMPVVSWETFLLAGWGSRSVIEVGSAEFDAVVAVRGSCATQTYCITADDVTTCGGPDGELEGTFYEEEDSEVLEEDPPEDSPVQEEVPPEEEEEEQVGTGMVRLTWTTPGNVVADRISLGGEYTSLATRKGEGWVLTLAEVTDAATVVYERSMAEGDVLRFSVEYEIDGVKSWSCLAPYPPGIVQGTATAVRDGISEVVMPADDPESAGCGLIFTVR